jgi:hypothetical protein
MKILRARFYLSSIYKSDYFRDEKILYPGQTPRFKIMIRYILIMERVKQLAQ